ncbi:MAG: hypothetical protein CMP23_16760 [Rickettsiales bacterium]|nr:hypothetical protein [Rickettsiales bacterium]|tara:strand:+ start:2522 stop:3055 length:534 start_codon:yes stop_codon:yes gene_type:complete
MTTLKESFRRGLRFGFALLSMMALALLVACPSGGRSSDMIAGKITTMKDQEVRPVAQAQIVIRPLTPDPEQKGSDEQPEDPVNLRGVSITNDTGYFEITSFSSDQTFQEYGLLRNWRYQITIQVPGYYIYRGPFSYGKGGQELTVQLEEKGSDVDDLTGVIEIDEKAIQTGSIRRGN